MIKISLPQRDFLNWFYAEYVKASFGPATKLAAEHGFYYEHFKALFESYRSACGENWGDPGDAIPESPQPSVFPWESVAELENQLKEEGIEVIPLPRVVTQPQLSS